MLIASWNVNSIRARIDRVREWLVARQPDLLCMQELKAEEKQFPREIFESLGYQVAAGFQKTYNGVAILSKLPLDEVTRGLDDGVDDPQERLIAATAGGIRFLCVYAPNGQIVGSDKWSYKLQWMTRLRAHLERRYQRTAPLMVCGDFNVAPEARDVHRPEEWEPSVLFHPEARAALAQITEWGLADSFRMKHPEPGFYTWWDYRMLGFARNNGLRIDHLLATPAVHLDDCWIDREARKGKSPSDHAPILATVSI